MASILPLELKNVSYLKQTNLILENINLKIEKGTPKILLGANGAGKTVLMRICHGLIKPTSGTIQWNSNLLQGKIKQQTMVFQRPIMLRQSVKKNLEFVLKIQKVSKNIMPTVIEASLSQVGMTKYLNYPAYLLSQGEQQKLAIARACLLKPQVLFLDEPTASLDPTSTFSIETIIRNIIHAGTLVIMSTHNLAQARRLQGEIIFISKGKVIQKCSAHNFFSQNQPDEVNKFLRFESS